MSKTVIISNRLPVKIERLGERLIFKKSEGGLATGLDSVYNSKNNIWIGWPGIAIRDEKERRFVRKELRKRNLIPLFLTEEEVEFFYQGFANEIIWPICHYRPSYSVFEKKSWLFYKQVNEKFANLAEQHIEGDDYIWIHDYHLMLLPQLLRRAHPQINIGYFQHIPFPSHEVFKLIPWRVELIEGLLGADLIGFHTSDYAHYFRDACARIAQKEIGRNSIELADRKVRVGNFPMGIDVEKYRAISTQRQTKLGSQLIKKSLQQNKIILSIDRLDYSKGIIERIKAVEQLLEKYPEYHQKIRLVQLVVPSRDSVKQYKILKDEIDRLVGQVNSKFAQNSWAPINYFYDSYPIEKVCALYGAADVCLVTPIRDGMNLVCKEFIACNSEEDSEGVLILSEMAGAAQELEDTFIINPTDIEQMTGTLYTALNLPEKTKQNILRKLLKKIRQNDVHNWIDQFMGTFQKIVREKEGIGKKQFPRKINSAYLSAYRKSKKRLFLIDYDGTLVPFTKVTQDAVPPKKVLKLLALLQNNPKNEVFIISGRKRDKLYKWHSQQNYCLLAEHGVLKLDQSGHWERQIRMSSGWKKAVKAIMRDVVKKTDKSFIEEKDCSLAWHYRAVEQKKVEEILPHLKQRLLKLKQMKHYELKILKGNKVLEIKSKRVDKGKAAKAIINQVIPDFILAIGDDPTDEDMFKALPRSAYTIKVGKEQSFAQYYLSGQNRVFEFLSSFLIKPLSRTINGHRNISIKR